MFNRYFGDSAFYRRVMAVAIPIIIQNGITNFVSLLDNIMVGQVGTLEMSGVSIVNQLLFVFNLCIFGAVSGAGIFTAQFHGSEDHQGVRNTFRFKLLVALLLSAIGLAALSFGGEFLIGLYLKGEAETARAALSLGYGKDYLVVMLLGLLPFALSNAYSSTLRETGHTMLPMVAGVTAVLVNLCGNYVLIFGHFGFEAMGVRGAAVATVVSRYVELAIIVAWTHLNSGKNPFIQGAYRSMRIPLALAKRIIAKGMPLMINEALWSTGMAFLNQCYSVRGLDVVAAMNISTTLNNLASVVYLAMGNVVGIIIGQMLGAGRSEKEVRDADRHLITLSVLSCFVFGGLMILFSGLFPQLYNATEGVQNTASALICVAGIAMPFCAYATSAYFTLRSGGQTFVTFLFDSCFVWVVCVPLAFCLSRFTALPIIPLYALCMATEALKCLLGMWMIKKGLWIRNLVHG